MDRMDTIHRMGPDGINQVIILIILSILSKESKPIRPEGCRVDDSIAVAG